MVTTGVVALARFADAGAARGGRFFGAMSDVLRTAQSVRRRAWRVNAIVLVVFWQPALRKMLSLIQSSRF